MVMPLGIKKIIEFYTWNGSILWYVKYIWMKLIKNVFLKKKSKGNAKECSNFCTIALISHASKVMLKILQARLQQ